MALGGSNSTAALPPHCFAPCRAKDSHLQLASAWRLLQVQQVYSASITMPLTLAADNLTAAQAQAVQLTTGSTATTALADALAAGLISGPALAVIFVPVHTALHLLLLHSCFSSGCPLNSTSTWQHSSAYVSSSQCPCLVFTLPKPSLPTRYSR